jgi:hypothetical protein
MERKGRDMKRIKQLNNGGPAFPVVHAIIPQPGSFTQTPEAHQGMTLRDWFAGMALQGNLAACAPGYEYTGGDSHQRAAEEAYRYADSMISARTGK